MKWQGFQTIKISGIIDKYLSWKTTEVTRLVDAGSLTFHGSWEAENIFSWETVNALQCKQLKEPVINN